MILFLQLIVSYGQFVFLCRYNCAIIYRQRWRDFSNFLPLRRIPVRSKETLRRAPRTPGVGHQCHHRVNTVVNRLNVRGLKAGQTYSV